MKVLFLLSVPVLLLGVVLALALRSNLARALGALSYGRTVQVGMSQGD